MVLTELPRILTELPWVSTELPWVLTHGFFKICHNALWVLTQKQMPAPVIEQTTARRRRAVVAKARFTKQYRIVLTLKKLVLFCKGAQKTMFNIAFKAKLLGENLNWFNDLLYLLLRL